VTQDCSPGAEENVVGSGQQQQQQQQQLDMQKGMRSTFSLVWQPVPLRRPMTSGCTTLTPFPPAPASPQPPLLLNSKVGAPRTAPHPPRC
jgi:hypothetical protein